MTRPNPEPSATWWACGVGMLGIGAIAAWLVLWFSPQSLSSLGRQAVAVLCISISVAPVLLIKPSEEGRP